MSEIIYQSNYSGSQIDGAITKVPIIEAELEQITPHLSDLITDADGAHGLKVESGNWTPVLYGIAVEGNNTYSTQFGEYYRIGKQIYFNFSIALSNKDVAMSGNVRVKGIPFTPTAQNKSLALGELNNITKLSEQQLLARLVPTAPYYIDLRLVGMSGLSAGVNASAIADNFLITGSGIYTIGG